MEYTNLITCIYARRSSEDLKDGESIENQVSLLKQYCTKMGYTNVYVFADDGFTGTNFNRPDFQKMYALIRHRRVKRVIVKDLSRFGRNSIEVGIYLGVDFPRYGVELISISDGPDSSDPDSILTQFKNMMNEFYAKDISDKQKLSLQARSNNGQHIATSPTFGYKLDPENRHHWIIDEPAAKTVRLVFHLYNSGLSIPDIAKELEANKHLSPSAYTGSIMKGSKTANNPYYWCHSSVSAILKRQEYCGDTVNFKTYHKSFKDKQVQYKDEADYVIIKDTQEPIISREEFEKARTRRLSNKRVKRERVVHILDSVVFCGNCGAKMYLNKRTSKKSGDSFVYMCNKYRKQNTCTAHYIQESDLTKKVIQSLLNLFALYKGGIRNCKKVISKAVYSLNETSIKQANERIEEIGKRISEISTLEARLYEDMCLGNITRDVFSSVTESYNKEAESLREEQGETLLLLDSIADKKKGVEVFLHKIAAFADFKEDDIDKCVVEQLIEKVELFETRKTLPSGKDVSTIEVRIHYVDVGMIEIE